MKYVLYDADRRELAVAEIDRIDGELHRGRLTARRFPPAIAVSFRVAAAGPAAER